MQLFEKIRKEIIKSVGDVKIEFDSKFADIAIPCFGYPDPVRTAEEFSQTLSKVSLFSRVKAKGPFVNIFLDWPSIGNDLIPSIDKNYGGKFIKGSGIIEHTSVNPNASPHVGRARNPIIGDSLVRLMRFAGLRLSVHYYVNDMGKQIALLVWAAQNRKKIDFKELLDLYIEANKKMESNKEVEASVFSLLEKFEKEDKKIVKQFRDVVSVAVEGQSEIFSQINVNYDKFDYESDYLDSVEMKEIMKKLKKTGKLFEDPEGRIVLNTTEIAKDSYFVLSRSNGTSLYGLRDLAYTLHKSKLAKDGLNIVVLGEDQKLYFQQVAYALKIAGYEPPKVVHYSFIVLPEGKMSTRKGNVVLLEDFLKEAYDKAYEEIANRYPNLKEKDRISRANSISVSAVRYGIVKVSPEKSVTFDINSAIRFEGDTGPYLQYSYARAKSILRKTKVKSGRIVFTDDETEIIKILNKFPQVTKKSFDELKPNHIAEYARSLCDIFNSYYQNVQVIGSPIEYSRVELVKAVSTVIGTCLDLLGIDKLDEM